MLQEVLVIRFEAVFCCCVWQVVGHRDK
jgi:hypothetical protein